MPSERYILGRTGLSLRAVGGSYLDQIMGLYLLANKLHGLGKAKALMKRAIIKDGASILNTEPDGFPR